MRFKRSALNYITWGLLCVILFAGVGISAIGVSEANSSSTYLFYVAAFYALFIFGCVILMVLYRLLRKTWKEKIASKIKIKGLLETALVFVVVIAAIVLRFVFAMIQQNDAGEFAFSGTAAYYEYAIGNLDTLGTASNIAYVYANSLKALFAVFSQTHIAVFVLQAFLAFGEMMFLFYALKESAGKIVAWIALLLVAFLPGSIALFTQCTPGLFLTFILSGYLFAAVMVISGSAKGRYTQGKYLILYGMLGLLTGAICYFDIIGVVMIPLTIYSFVVFRSKTVSDTASKPLIQSLVYLGMTLVTLSVSLFGFPSGVEAGVTGIARFIACFVPREGINLTLLTPLFGNWDALLIYILAGFWILAFLKTKTDKAFAFSVVVIAMVAFQFFTFDHTDYIPFVSLCFSAIAAIGFSCLKFVFASEDALAELEKAEETAYNDKIESDKKRPSRKPLFGGGRIITLGDDLHADLVEEDKNLIKPEEPEKKEEPVKIEEPKKVEEPVKIEEPEKAEEPVKAEEPEKAEEPVKIEEPEIAEEPVKIEEPEKEEEPVKIEEPEKVEEPVVEEPEKVEEPVVEESEKGEEPVVEEPAKAEEPVKEEEAPKEEKKEERVLPPYVPQKMMLRRRGKMFSPVKKAEPSDEEVNASAPAAETPVVAEPAAPVAETPVVAEPAVSEPVTPVAETPAVSEPVTPVAETPAVETPVAETSVVDKPAVAAEVPAAPVHTAFAQPKPVVETPVSAVKEPEPKPAEAVKEPEAKPVEAVKEIHNPLPGPKPHVVRELTFDYDVKDDEWDYDLKDLGDKDDYDI